MDAALAFKDPTKFLSTSRFGEINCKLSILHFIAYLKLGLGLHGFGILIKAINVSSNVNAKAPHHAANPSLNVCRFAGAPNNTGKNIATGKIKIAFKFKPMALFSLCSLRVISPSYVIGLS